MKKAKILLYDIEVAYTVGAVWELYDTSVTKVLREPFMLSVAYKFLGEKETKVISLPDFPLYKKDKFNDKELVKKLHELFSEADIIVAHNGNNFDQKWAYARFIVHGMEPPRQAKYVDTKLVAKAKFRFNSNSLNNLASYFGIGQKVETGGIDLWFDCIERADMKAWKLMCKYNKQDVVLLEKVYERLLPYITNHPNLNLINGTECNCPNCGGSNLQKRGFYHTRTSICQRYQCQDCGAWSSGNKIVR